MDYFFELLAVTGEKDGASAGAVADAYYIALDILGAIGGCVEGLIVATMAGGLVCC